ncbi:hypothetical protein NESM_000198000 [Novymonas esmeraldas]|uniref:Uncharacterized protein n=1 Tax=Novymonas esmeraldas TaxID=1808958 RepID=A0AAW0F9P3_9TRYP
MIPPSSIAVSDVRLHPAPLAAGGVEDSGSRFSYSSLSSWCRQRLLPTLFPSPGTGATSLPSLDAHGVVTGEADTRAAAAAVAPPLMLTRLPACEPLPAAATTARVSLVATPNVPSAAEPMSHALAAVPQGSVADAALLLSLRLPSAQRPHHGLVGGGGVMTDSFASVDTSPTPGPAASFSGGTTPKLGPSSTSFAVYDLGHKPGTAGGAAVDRLTTVLPFSSGRLGGYPASTSPSVLPLISPSSSFAAPTDSLAASLRSPLACVELPGPQSLFVRGSDALSCSGRSQHLLRADSRAEMSGSTSALTKV